MQLFHDITVAMTSQLIVFHGVTWHVTHSVWHSCVFPHLNSPYISVMDPVSSPPAVVRGHCHEIHWPQPIAHGYAKCTECHLQMDRADCKGKPVSTRDWVRTWWWSDLKWLCNEVHVLSAYRQGLCPTLYSLWWSEWCLFSAQRLW